MDDEPCFTAFLNIAGLTLVRQRNAFTDNFCKTFTEFSQTSEREIDQYVKRNDEDNRNRAQNQQVIFTVRFLKNIKAVLMELQDQMRCLATPDMAMLNSIDIDTLRSMRLSYSQYTRDSEQRNNQKLPEKTVCKLSGKTWGIFKVDIQECMNRIIGVNSIPLSYIICPNDHNTYEAHYETRMDKLINCIAHSGDAFKED